LSATLHTLPAEDLAHYREHGYLLLRGLFAAEAVRRFEARFRELVLEPNLRPASLKIVRDVMIAKGAVPAASPLHAVNKLLHFEDDPVLFEYVTDAKLLGAVRGLAGGPLMSVATNVFNKPPGVDGRHPLHQDLLYFPLRPAEKVVGTWTALQPARRENGCLCILPGSHRGPLHRHAEPDWEHLNRYFFGVEDADRDARVHLEMEPGDTLLFHPLLLHGSGRNRSSDFRRAISAHFARVDCDRLPGPSPQREHFRTLGPQRPGG
jgi:phytanoyl-CoA hydroxylase